MITAPSHPPVLDEEQLSRFREDGFAVVEDLLSEAEVEAFLDHQAKRPAELDLGLRSHVADPFYGYLARHPRIAGGAAQILGGTPCIVQSMYLPKLAGQPFEARVGIALHQDSHYLPNEPNTLMACWIALNDTDGGNGGLVAVPGSHRQGLRPAHPAASAEHVRFEQEYRMRDRTGREWSELLYAFEIDGVESLPLQSLEVRRGSGVFFTGMTVHGSYANRSPDRDRLAFAVHYVKDGTWVLRTDVQETVAVTEWSTSMPGT